MAGITTTSVHTTVP